MPRHRITLGIGAALLAASLVACASSTDTAESSGATSELPTEDGVFPVTIQHAFGETVIEEQPEQVATVAWANHEVPLALGVVPVGFSAATWGDDDGNGVLPWVEDQLNELGASTPVLFEDTDGFDYEAIADTNPDVILASYSGLSEDEYATLSEIAPTIAYPETAWGTSWQDMVRYNSAAIGLAGSGLALIDTLQGEIDDALAAHGELQDAAIVFSYLDPSDLSTIGFYTDHDPRAGFFVGLGLPSPQAVAAATEASDSFYAEISAEQADEFNDVDILVTYGDTGSDLVAQLQADPLLSQIPAVQAGQVVVLENDTPLAAAANPSPLSIGWGIEDYFALLAHALA